MLILLPTEVGWTEKWYTDSPGWLRNLRQHQ